MRARPRNRTVRGELPSLLARIPAAAYTCDADGLITDFNERAVALWGREPKRNDPADRYCGSFRLFSPDGQPIVHDECWMALALREGVDHQGQEIVVEREDGSRVHALAHASPLRDRRNKIYGGLNVLVDITAQKRAEETSALLAAIVTSSDDAIVSKSLDGRILSWNAGAERLFGYPAEEAVGRSITLIVPRELLDEEASILHRVRGGERIEHYETTRVARDGRRVEVSLTISPVRDGRGRIIGASKVARDITERKLAEEALRQSEERYRRLAGLLPVGMYTCDALTGAITYYNRQAAELWGRAPRVGDSEERFCGSWRMYSCGGEPLPHEQCPMAAALREGIGFRNRQVEIERPDGSRRTVLVNIDAIRDSGGKIVGAVNVFLDVSAQRQAEEALREQKEQLEALLETLPVAVFMAHDAECRQISGNRAAAELLRVPATGNFSLTAPDGERPTQFRILRDGREAPPEDLPMQRAAKGAVVVAEEVDHLFDDGTLCRTIVSAKPLFGSDGRPRGAVAAMQDITSLRNAEAELREADRRKDEFLAMLAHELRNPLAPLRSGLDLLALDNASPDVVDLMSRQVEQMVRLVDDLLDVSRITRGRIELRRAPVELAEVASRAIETARPLFEARRHRFDCTLPADAVWLDADAVRLAQAVSNLLVNAAKYTEPGGQIRLTAHLDGEEVAVAIGDNGIGIEPSMMVRIFDLFAQEDRAIDRAQGGLGIGLTLAKSLVEMHGGRVSARSDGPGAGSEFTVRLPVLSRGRKSSAARRPVAAAVGRRILVVDDNVASTTILSRLLAKTGAHDVRAAHDGSSALQVAAELRPDLAILDIGLPQMDGYEVARQLRRQFGPDLLLVALTGYGAADDLRRSRAAGFDEHLVKPPDFAALQGLFGHAKLAANGGPRLDATTARIANPRT